MRVIGFLFRKKFYLLVLSLLLFTFSLSVFFRTILIQFFTTDNRNIPINRNQDINKTTESISSFKPEQIDEIVEGNLIRGTNQASINLGKGETKESNVELSLEIGLMVVRGIISGNSSFARVTVESMKNESEEYRVGDKIGDFRILQINEHTITLGRSTYSFKVEVGETIQFAYNKFIPNLELPEKNSQAATEHKPTPISRTDINRILKNPELIYVGATFGPNLKNGNIDGLKIGSVVSSHLFYQLGARSGDIIKRVNGMPLG